MKNTLLLALLLMSLQISAQDFSQSPYQDFGMSSPIIADFNGDNQADVLGIQFSANPNLLVLKINDGGTPIAFTEKDLNLNLNFDVWGQPAAADFDGDNDLDIVFGGTGSLLYLLLNDGAANFTLVPLGVSGAYRLKVVDIDNDTDLDIVGGNEDENALHLFVNDGNQNFTKKTIVNNSGTEDLNIFDTGDLDQDGDIDIVAGFDQFSGKQIVLFKNIGSNNFEEVILVANEFSSLENLLIVDINSDGKNDVIATRSFNCDAFVNQGGLVFQRKNLASVSNFVRSVATGDFNGDGKKDLVIGTNSANITWHKNLSNTTLAFESYTVGGVAPCFSIVNGDLDNDGDEDLVVSNGEFWWYENKVIQESSSTLGFPEIDITIFPNPFNDAIQINNLGQDSYIIKMVDTNGRMVYSAPVNSNFIDLSPLHSGLYFLTLINTTTHQSRSTSIMKGN